MARVVFEISLEACSSKAPMIRRTKIWLGSSPRRPSHRDDVDAVLAQLPNGQLDLGNVAEETIEGVEADCIRFDWMQSAG
jgi:hypothetical protein